MISRIEESESPEILSTLVFRGSLWLKPPQDVNLVRVSDAGFRDPMACAVARLVLIVTSDDALFSGEK
jgi:hypothetical protein